MGLTKAGREMVASDSSRKIVVGIVGAGNMATEHARAFASLPGVTIGGVCGRNPERVIALASKYGAATFASATEMHASLRPDAVIVAVSEIAMKAICAEVFSLPWACLLEKPVGLDLEEAASIRDMADRAGASAYVAFNRRSYSSTLEAQARLSADAGPRLISILDQQDLGPVRANNRAQRVIDNYMFANSIHLIDYFTQFGRGDVRKVNHVRRWNAKAPGRVIATLEFESGDLGVYQAVWDGPGPWAVTITDGSVRTELRPLEKLSVQLMGERKVTDIQVAQADIDFKPGLLRQAQQFAAAVRGGTTDLATIHDSYKSMALCAAIYDAGA